MACASATLPMAAAASLAPVAAAPKLPARTGLAMAAPACCSLSRAGFVANKSRISMSLPAKEHNVAGLAGLALVVAAVVPEMAEAAQPGVSASLRNLMLSVVAGGVVLTAIAGAVAGVSTFDPVSRR